MSNIIIDPSDKILEVERKPVPSNPDEVGLASPKPYIVEKKEENGYAIKFEFDDRNLAIACFCTSLSSYYCVELRKVIGDDVTIIARFHENGIQEFLN